MLMKNPLHHIRRHRLRGALSVAPMIATALLLGACGNTAPLTASTSPADSGSIEASFTQFSDVPIPAGAKMDLERSLVLGERDRWIGRLVMGVSMNAGAVYDFYFAEMPRFGWTPITTVRAGTSVLTYTRGVRVATIQIERRTLGGAYISMIVSPGRNQPVGMGAASPLNGAPVRTVPLR